MSGGRHASDFALLRSWVVARLKSTLRTPRAAFFTIVFPVLLLVLLCSTNGDSTVTVPGGTLSFAQYFTASLAVYGLAVACYVLPIIGLASARDAGVLKRVRGTPLTPWVYLASWGVGVVLIGLAAATLLVVVGAVAFGVDVYPSLLPAAVVTAIVGAVSLAALGLAVSTYVRRAETAPAIANLTLFPLSFLSGVFFPTENAPQWVRTLADIFPLSHLVSAFAACFSPYTTGSGFSAGDLAVVAVWGLVALQIAAWRFRWESEPESREGRVRRLGRPTESS